MDFFAEIVVKCEVKPFPCMCIAIYIYIYIYIIVRIGFIFNYAHSPKPGILLRSSECLKLLTRNHYKNI